MSQKSVRVFSCIVVGVLVAVGSARAESSQLPKSQPLPAPAIEAPLTPAAEAPASPVVATPATPGASDALASPGPSLAPFEIPQPQFMTLGECRAACYSDFQACKLHNPYSFCLTLYNYCFCGCNDSCNP